MSVLNQISYFTRQRDTVIISRAPFMLQIVSHMLLIAIKMLQIEAIQVSFCSWFITISLQVAYWSAHIINFF